MAGAGRPVAIPQFVMGVNVSTDYRISLRLERMEEVADRSLSAGGVEVTNGQCVLEVLVWVDAWGFGVCRWVVLRWWVGVLGVGMWRLMPRKQSASLKASVGFQCADLRMYVAHLGLVGLGRNMSKSVRGGSSLLTLSHGS